ncbi:MAG TPA: secondary thiamine-phosphate synthase enzyme YjbQ [Beijerinckiaceae bacterium]|nr:secondary thiamine-phosphate synthase enzyme YjbQ [Beijerinckiaceae bacterium]
MRQTQEVIEISTRGRGLVEITSELAAFTRRSGFQTGLLSVFCRHTSASLLIQENAGPSVRADLEAFFARLAPEAPGRYIHEDEGPDDMPAHIRAALTQTSLAVPITDGELALGTWQGVYVFEHRRAPHARELVLHALGE